MPVSPKTRSKDYLKLVKNEKLINNMTAKDRNNKIRKYLWFAIFVTNLIAIVLLLASTQAWHFIPSKAPIFSFLGMGFPVLVIANIIYLIFWIFVFKWQYILAELIVLMFCWTPIQTYMPMNEPTENVPEESFRVLSYNVRHFNWLIGKEARENPIFDYILEQNPDIICFQEFGVAKTKSAKGLISKGEVDKKLKDYPYTDFVQLGNPNSHLMYGLAIYSKYPIRSTAKIPYWSKFNGCVFHELIIQDKRITLVNTHLESNRITSDDKKLYKDFLTSDKEVKLKHVTNNIKAKLSVAFTIREEQADMIQSYVKGLDTYATIICGDFNDTPISYTYNKMKGDLVDSFVETGRGLGISYHENMFLFRIDYIFHSINMKAYNMKVGDQKHSDHYPVWTDLIFK